MNALQAHNAVTARINGVFDDPDLVAIGPLSEYVDEDVAFIKRKFLLECGFTVGVRDPELNRNYPGEFMACECYDEKEGPTDDGSNGP